MTRLAMSDYIEIQKLWFDDCLMQLNVVCASSVVTSIGVFL